MMSAAPKWLPVRRWSGATSGVPRWLLYSGLAAGAGLAMAGVMWLNKPAFVINFKMRLALQKAGFKVKHVQGREYSYCYAERGVLRSDQPSIVCIGGLSGCKEDWMLLVGGIQTDFHIILLDLPGQGQSSVPTDLRQASLYAFTDMLAEFLQLTDTEAVPIHLVGISMGASLSALYTAKYPRTVDRLTLMCPSMQCPIETEAWQEVSVRADNKNNNSLINLSSNAFFDPDRIPKSIWEYRSLQQTDKTKLEFHKQLRHQQFVELTEESKKFEGQLALIKVPTQVIWGENDEILHVSGASLLEEILPDVKRMDMLEECGHAIHLEKPDTARGVIMDFHNTTYSS